jgi:hypothetical protein
LAATPKNTCPTTLPDSVKFREGSGNGREYSKGKDENGENELGRRSVVLM